jgi:hypothetical protein
MSRRWAAVLLVALVGAPLAACSDDGPGEGEARLEVDGRARVERADGGVDDVDDDDTDLSPGDRVEVRDGVAVMRLRGGTTFELRAGLDGADDTAVLMADRPVLESGDLLVATPGTAQLEADGTEVDVIDGAARLSRAFGMSVSAYDADIALDSAGATAEVRALRRLTVPDLGQLPSAPRPVAYDEKDPWDRRYLGAAIAVGGSLEDLARRLFTDVLPEGSGRTAGFFELVLPDLEAEEAFEADLLDPRVDPSETFIGAAITVEGERGEFADRWQSVFTFREEGADWGIVALDQAVRSEPLLGSVEEAFNTQFEEVAQAPLDAPPDTGSTGGTDGGTDGGGGADGSTDGSDGSTGGTDGSPPTSDPPTTDPTLPPIITPPSEEPPDELEPVIEPVVDLVEDLLGGLLP